MNKYRLFLLGVFAVLLMGVAPTTEIDRIDVTGVTHFGRTEVEGALELSVGDRLERSRVVKTAENLITLYKLKGYEQVQVKGELVKEKNERGQIETVLRFAIQEGRPTRVASARIISVGVREGSASNAVDIAPGEILDQEKIATAKRTLQENLASEEYVGAKIDEVRIVDAKPPAGLQPLPDAARWVDISFRVDLGDRATFGFRGNEFFNRSELMAFVTDQRVIGLAKDYVGAIQKRIIDEYRAKGFANVTAASYIFEKPERNERHITYEISEGARVEIESLDFDGNSSFSGDQLKREYFNRASPLVQRKYYVEKEVQASADLLIEWIQSQGYLSSKLVAVNRTFVDGNKKVRLIVYVYEGDQTLIESIQIDGDQALSKPEIMTQLGIAVSQPLNLFAFNEGLEVLKRTYRSRGFLDMRIANEDSEKVVEYSQDNRSAEVHIEVIEGTQYRISRVDIDGLGQTQANVVSRELTFKPGDVLEDAKIQDSESRIRRLGIFAEATIRWQDDPNRPGHKIVKVVLQEGSPGLIAGGPGYRQDLGVRGFFQTAYSNINGKNHEVNFNLALNYRGWGGQVYCNTRDYPERCLSKPYLEGQAQVGYVWPWFMGDRTAFRPRIQYEKTRYVNFDVESASGALIWERRLLSAPNLVAGFTYNLERTKQANSLNEIDNRTLTIGALIPSLRLDLRDNSLAASRGIFAFTSFEVADPSFGSQSDPPVGYYRFQSRLDGFVPLARDVTWFLSFRTGYVRNNVVAPAGVTDQATLNQYALPMVKQFALGGITSLRGFQEQELNFQNLIILGSMSYVNYRTQLDLPFAGALRFGPFFDAANLIQDSYSLTRDMNFGTGFGFHYQSPVGPVNFDVGFRLGEVPPTLNRQQFYFSIGVL